MATPLKLGGGDQFSADPQTLRDTAPTYYQAAQQINSLQQSLVSTVQMAAGDMFLLLEFSQLASRLEQLQARIDAAMQCASMGLNRIGIAISIAADEYKETDLQVSSTFQRIEDDTHQSNPPRITIPGITVPGTTTGNTPSTTPQPLPQPGVQPEPNPPLIPPIIIPGITSPGGILSNLFPTQSQPGVQKPLQKQNPQESTGTQPDPTPWIPFEPEI